MVWHGVIWWRIATEVDMNRLWWHEDLSVWWTCNVSERQCCIEEEGE